MIMCVSVFAGSIHKMLGKGRMLAKIGLFLAVFLCLSSVSAWSSSDSILLKDIQVLTLHSGKSTTGECIFFFIVE